MSFESIELENQKNQVLIYEKNEKLLCPRCMYPVAELAALKEIDIPVPKFCENCGHKLHYSSRAATISTDKKMGVIFWVYEKWKFGEADEDSEFEFFADENGAKNYFKKHLQERKDCNFFEGLLENPLSEIEEEDDYFGLHYEGPFVISDYELYIEKFDVHPAEGGDEGDT